MFGWLTYKTAKQGAQTSIHCVVSEDVKGVTGNILNVVCMAVTDLLCFEGKYFSDCAVKAPSKLALDDEAAEKLWKKSEEWTKL